MRWTKNWGTVSSGAELHMLAHAERTRKQLAKKKRDDKNKDKNRIYRYRSYARKYVRDIASQDDLLELRKMIDERLD